MILNKKETTTILRTLKKEKINILLKLTGIREGIERSMYEKEIIKDLEQELKELNELYNKLVNDFELLGLIIL